MHLTGSSGLEIIGIPITRKSSLLKSQHTMPLHFWQGSVRIKPKYIFYTPTLPTCHNTYILLRNQEAEKGCPRPASPAIQSPDYGCQSSSTKLDFLWESSCCYTIHASSPLLRADPSLNPPPYPGRHLSLLVFAHPSFCNNQLILHVIVGPA